jgi:hypothetical protein
MQRTLATAVLGGNNLNLNTDLVDRNPIIE